MRGLETAANIREKTVGLLGPGGIIPETLQGYEFRPQQLEMAESISESIENGRHLIAEAGTGVGKSLAYLVPFMIYAADKDKKVVVSTYTKTLQNQLYHKDLPFLKKYSGIDFNYSLCLGSENYLCLRRLNSEFTYDLFDSDSQLREIREILKWAAETRSGVRSDLDFVPREEVWSGICREPDLCLGNKCSHKKNCFYKKAKAREKKAHILITNHSLFFTNLASGGQVLPNFHAVVFDEAQTLEQVATSYLGLEVTNTRIKYLFDSIYNPNTRKGLLAKFRGASSRTVKNIEARLDEAREASQKFFKEAAKAFGDETESKRIRTKNIVFNWLEEPLKNLTAALGELLDRAKTDEDEALIKSYLKRCVATSTAMAFILNNARDDYVYWIEIVRKRRGTRYSFFASPVEIAEALDKNLFSQIGPIVLTSATLSANGDFEYIKGRLGMKGCEELLLDSPFDYKNNVILYLPRKIEDPNSKFDIFQDQVVGHINSIIHIMKGRIFILFTSYKMLNSVYDRLVSGHPDINLLKQGDKPRYELLRSFIRHGNSVLLGTNTFWQGVDVPGRPLECVIITKLPFSVPDDPITEARAELIESRGGNPFLEYQVPQAIMLFKQGFGRLIRTKADRGVVAVLDPRIRTRFYGRSFINALPKCRHAFDIGEIEKFFEH